MFFTVTRNIYNVFNFVHCIYLFILATSQSVPRGVIDANQLLFFITCSATCVGRLLKMINIRQSKRIKFGQIAANLHIIQIRGYILSLQRFSSVIKQRSNLSRKSADANLVVTKVVSAYLVIKGKETHLNNLLKVQHTFDGSGIGHFSYGSEIFRSKIIKFMLIY